MTKYIFALVSLLYLSTSTLHSQTQEEINELLNIKVPIPWPDYDSPEYIWDHQTFPYYTEMISEDSASLMAYGDTADYKEQRAEQIDFIDSVINHSYVGSFTYFEDIIASDIARSISTGKMIALASRAMESLEQSIRPGDCLNYYQFQSVQKMEVYLNKIPFAAEFKLAHIGLSKRLYRLQHPQRL